MRRFLFSATATIALLLSVLPAAAAPAADVNAGVQPLDGTAKVVTIATAGNTAYTTFTGSANQRLIIQASDASPVFGCCAVSWWVAKADGTRVSSNGWATAAVETTLPAAGAYKVVIDPDGTLTGSITLRAWTVPADLDAGALALTGAQKTVTITQPGRNAFVSFAGTANRRVLFKATTAIVNVEWRLYSPTGVQIGGTMHETTVLELVLPATGTYKVVVDPQRVLTGSLTLAAWDEQPQVDAGPLTLGGTAKTVTIGRPGGTTAITVTGTAGQRLILEASGGEAVFGCCWLYWTIFGPDGSVVSQHIGDDVPELTLATSGTYKVVFDPDADRTGALTLRGWVVPADLNAGAHVLTGAPRTLTFTGPGQNGYTTLAATAGQHILIETSQVSASYGCCFVRWRLVAPDGSRPLDWARHNGANIQLRVPQTGTYRVEFDPQDTRVGSITVQAWTVAATDLDLGVLPVDGTAKVITLTEPGRNAFLTFSGTAGSRVRIASSDASPQFQRAGLLWRVFAPNGTQLDSNQWVDWTTDFSLPQTGTYKITLDAVGGLTGTLTLRATRL
ncbi:hypothetical protein JOD54_005245 [Actinokineospora baliensis]|uniref:hypothetical protein n=1 Tax=Actinokineospora baliensis TaxID=547056 RepID=UPI001956EF61|nr:hypothetical protein [Actinokineospora baliensis]MBM7775041.1 hypothetical protein [Actinokineospora baliensis]